MKNPTLETLAKELTTKNNWLHKNLQKILNEINSKTSECEVIRQTVLFDEQNFSSYVYYLKTGSETSKSLFRVNTESYHYGIYTSSEYIDAEDIPDNILRPLINALPKAIDNLKEKMQERINFEFPKFNS